jgi:hypothetical protein
LLFAVSGSHTVLVEFVEVQILYVYIGVPVLQLALLSCARSKLGELTASGTASMIRAASKSTGTVAVTGTLSTTSMSRFA